MEKKICKEIGLEVIGDIIQKAPKNRLYFGNLDVDGVDAMKSESWQCIDNRVQEVGWLRYPGGSAGLFLSFLAVIQNIGLQVKENEIADYFKSEMGDFYLHSDAYNQDKKPECADCGHLMLENSYNAEYGLGESLDIFELIGASGKDAKSHSSCLILDGEHKGEFVLDIAPNAKNIVALPSSFLGDRQFFVSHSQVAISVLLRLFDKYARVYKIDKSISVEARANIPKVVLQHIHNTLGFLAKKFGKDQYPIYQTTNY